MLQYVTDFADLAVTLPVAVLASLTLSWQRAARQGGMLVLAVAATLAVVTALKLATFVAWPPDAGIDLQSPSGHTAGAIIVYGGLLQVLGPRGWRVGGAIGIALTVAFTRVALGVHTMADVCVGAAAGGGGLCFLAWLLSLRGAAPGGAPPGRAPRPAPALAAAAVAMIVMHGQHFGGEDALRDLAARLRPAIAAVGVGRPLHG